MAINKTKNMNLQITISITDVERLENIRAKISQQLDIELTKSQVIAFLIKNYGKETTQTTKTEKPQNRALKGGFNYQAQVIALKDKLNVSYPRLSQIIGIPESTLKKYANGKQQPTGDNEQLLKESLKKYGIK